MSEKPVNEEVFVGNDEENFEENESMAYDSDDDFVIDNDESTGKSDPASAHLLNLRLPKSLFNRLRLMATDEGVSLEDLAFELISEGSVIRAWEIVEKKSTMRQGTGSPGNQQNGGNNNFRYRQNNRNGGGQPRRGNNGRRSGPNIHKIIDDKAQFMEYVRNQEKKNNR